MRRPLPRRPGCSVFAWAGEGHAALISPDGDKPGLAFRAHVPRRVLAGRPTPHIPAGGDPLESGRTQRKPLLFQLLSGLLLLRLAARRFLLLFQEPPRSTRISSGAPSVYAIDAVSRTARSGNAAGSPLGKAALGPARCRPSQERRSQARDRA